LRTAHPTDIFSLAALPGAIISASGSSNLKIHDTTRQDFPLIQEIKGAHKLGIHHVATSLNGKVAASVGFEGKVKIWSFNDDGQWELDGEIANDKKTSELWAIALSESGQYLAGTTHNGCINVWDTKAEDMPKISTYETKGSFGMCVDLVCISVCRAS
jgi:superkiller protein 8